MALDRRLVLAFPGPTFEDNIKRLEMHCGFPRTEAPMQVIRLTNQAGNTLLIRAELGKFVSVFFLNWLSRKLRTFTIDADIHKVVRKFYDPIWNEPNHVTITFLREPGVKVQLFADETELKLDQGQSARQS